MHGAVELPPIALQPVEEFKERRVRARGLHDFL
jgi:hypothetical protein